MGAVRADQGQLEQVILNLAVNASAAMEKGGELTIRTFNQKIDSLNSTPQDMFSPDKEAIEHGNYVVIEVIDTGCGMTSDTTEKIFDPFFLPKILPLVQVLASLLYMALLNKLKDTSMLLAK